MQPEIKYEDVSLRLPEELLTRLRIQANHAGLTLSKYIAELASS
jgi:predicted DNA binding CopG/RHH family protein